MVIQWQHVKNQPQRFGGRLSGAQYKLRFICGLGAKSREPNDMVEVPIDQQLPRDCWSNPAE